MDGREAPKAPLVQIRVACAGNVDSGKSTLVGVLTRGILDDSRGRARAHVFLHKHELETGRSSSVSTEVMAFGPDGAVVVPPGAERCSRQDLFINAATRGTRSVTFVDLCGHEAYLKTTAYGLTALLPDYCFVLVGANMGVQRMTKEHIGIAIALGIPFAVVVTKTDLAPPDVLRHTLDTINKVLKQARRVPFRVANPEQAATAARSIGTDRVVPIFCVSNTEGTGLDSVRAFLALVPPRVSTLARRGEALRAAGPVGGGLEFKSSGAAGGGGAAAPAPVTGAEAVPAEAGGEGAPAPARVASSGGSGAAPADTALQIPAGAAGTPREEGGEAGGAAMPAGAPLPGSDEPGEACLDSVFNVAGVGTVVAGTVLRGCIRSGSTMMLGPDKFGVFVPVVVRSIHVHYISQDAAWAGGSAAFAIRPKASKKSSSKDAKSWVHKGMSLVAPELAPVAHWEFSAEVLILHHQTTLSTGYTPVVHVGVVTQAARITRISGLDGGPLPALRTGDRAILTFRWAFRPEFVHVNDSVLFREGRCKGVGRILELAQPHHPSAAALAAAGSHAGAAGGGGGAAVAE